MLKHLEPNNTNKANRSKHSRLSPTRTFPLPVQRKSWHFFRQSLCDIWSSKPPARFPNKKRSFFLLWMARGAPQRQGHQALHFTTYGSIALALNGVEWLQHPKKDLLAVTQWPTYMNFHSCKACSCYRNIYMCSWISWTSCLPAGIPALSCPSIFLLMPLISNQKKLAHGGSTHLLSSAPNTRNISDVAGRRWTIHWAGPSSANALVARAACTTFGLVSEVRFALFAGQAACEAPKQGTMKGPWLAYKCAACDALLGTACTGRVEASTKWEHSK